MSLKNWFFARFFPKSAISQKSILDLPFNNATQEHTVTTELLNAQKRGDTKVKFLGLLNTSVLQTLQKQGYRVEESGFNTTVFIGVLKTPPKSIRKPHQFSNNL